MKNNIFRMPAEWEPHAATWIGWPQNENDWPGKLAAIKWCYCEIVKKISQAERVRILISEKNISEAKQMLEQAEVDLTVIDFVIADCNRNWTRDTGPIFVKNDKQKSIRKFKFNAWAKYSDYQLDQHIPKIAADFLKLEMLEIEQSSNFVLEGGAIDINGTGTLLSTKECLLDQEIQVRNPGLSQVEIENVLKVNLGVTNILWLNKGIVGDDTHGHVDDICRFVNPKTLILASESDPKDPNYTILNENREISQEFILEDGSKPEVIDLPMPKALYFDGLRLPASYANFYICNHSVLVPTFNDLNDRLALGILADLFPNRQVIGIHALDLVWGFGTLHCLTQQEPL